MDFLGVIIVKFLLASKEAKLIWRRGLGKFLVRGSAEACLLVRECRGVNIEVLDIFIEWKQMRGKRN